MPRGPRLLVAARRRSTWVPRPTSRSPTFVPRHSARGMAWWTLSPFSAGPVDDSATDDGRFSPIRTEDGEIIDLSDRVSGPGVESRTVRGQVGETYRGDTEAAVNEITKRVRDSWRVVVMAEGRRHCRPDRRGAQ